MTAKIIAEHKRVLISKIPMGRLGTPEDVSNCAAFLASNLSDYITGETIHVIGVYVYVLTNYDEFFNKN